MKIVLWILQILLALYNIAGGIFIIFNNQQVTTHWAYTTFPQPFWVLLGIVEIIAAIGMLIPKMKGSLKNLNAISAVILTVITFSGAFLYVTYQGFPGMLWAIVPALLTGFVAYKRWEK